MTSQTLDIRGMHCAACAQRVEKTVAKLEGVTSASVNLATEKLTVGYESQTIRLPAIREAIAQAGFEARKRFVQELATRMNEKYGENTVRLEVKERYFNMKDRIPPEVVEYAKAAFAEAGVTPDIVAIRGGTDGAMLSYQGLPCPNIFTGGHNFHGPYEFISVESMEKAVNIVIKLCAERK